MLALSTSRAVPISPLYVAKTSSSPYHLPAPTAPHDTDWHRYLPYPDELIGPSQHTLVDLNFARTQWNTGLPASMHGLEGCGCNPVTGCSCVPIPPTLGGLGYDWSHIGLPANLNRLHGLDQGAPSSLDQIIASAFQWLSGLTQSALPPSAAVPPQYGSSGALLTQLQQYLPYIIGGFFIYKLVK